MQVLIRCDKPELLASKMFEVNHCVEARLHADGNGVFLRTGDIDQFYRLLNEIAVEGLVKIEAVAPADDDANAIYQYLIGSDGERLMMQQSVGSAIGILRQQPWSLWWLQARRLTRIEIRRNLFTQAGVVDLLSRLRSDGHHPHSSALRPALRSGHERGHPGAGRNRAVLLCPAGNFLRVPGNFFAADSRRDDRAQPALLPAFAGAPRSDPAVEVFCGRGELR